MAKKGGAQQLQDNITNDEEFEKFLDRPGLLVLDVYSEWCGPCLGMVGSLKKIKLEMGGDSLHLAINHKAVNLMFGSNVPKLMQLISDELKHLNSKAPRKTYEITELQPEEVERRKVKEYAIAEAIRVEQTEKLKKRRDYLTYVTDSIMENLPDIGVTIFGPQVNRDMFKKLMEPADIIKIQCKDRKITQVTKEIFEVINFACKNPLDEEIIEQLNERELLICFWKMPDGTKSVAETLTHYATELTKKGTHVDEATGEEIEMPPILAPLDIKIEYELDDEEECVEIEEEAPPDRKSHLKSVISEAAVEQVDEGADADDEEEEEGEDEGEGEGEGLEEPSAMNMERSFVNFSMADDENEEVEEEEEVEHVVEGPPPKRMCHRKVTLPAVWVPHDDRTHAALIYVFFRGQTTPFLEPDPVPEPPHVIMAFDVYKKNDLVGVAERNKDDIPLYGFFTSDDADDAEFICNTLEKYKTKPHTAGDKIVFKVNKQTSHTMLNLATYGPSYVSPNTVIGHEEALKFFGESYKTGEQEMLEEMVQREEENKKLRKQSKRATESKRKVSHASHAAEPGPGAAPGPEAESPPPTTESGEESGESMPPQEGTPAPPTEDAPAAPSDETPAQVAEEATAPADAVEEGARMSGDAQQPPAETAAE